MRWEREKYLYDVQKVKMEGKKTGNSDPSFLMLSCTRYNQWTGNWSPTKHTQDIINTAFPVYVLINTVQPLIQPLVHTSPKTLKKKADRKKDRKRQRKKQRNRERIERKIIKKKYI